MIHREGLTILILAALIIGLIIVGGFYLHPWAGWFLVLGGSGLWLFMLQFFRNPKRPLPVEDPQKIYSPADGKVVVIERQEESEFLQEQCLQISIFMSTWNVHANRNPIPGEVVYLQHHPGTYLVAWHPKSSTENERFTTAIRNEQATIVFRQIAGAVARRIRNYLKVGEHVQQGAQMGFIKFGSRVDIFLPPDAEVRVAIGQQVKAGMDVLAKIK
ncbi:MAG: phosphatidylserine decarboxylase family protein [Phaeodactylibacter sp.]|nr:phosphatidylserine decarboxylase family protein [Phaeodactylibacter sp.]